jgi:hypothetical protein
VEDIDNVGKNDSVEEDKGTINKHGTHMMQLAWVINQGHLHQEVLPIHAYEDPYMI